MVKCQTQLQLTGNDCCLANGTAIGHGIDPTHVMYDQSAMQWHLLKCFKEENLTIFPTLN